MSKKIAALIFGHNEYAFEVAKNVEHKYEDITIFKLSSDEKLEYDKNYDIKNFDFSDDWDDLVENFNMKNSIAFCMLEDDAQNIFLTISLRSMFKDLTIFALSKNKESAHKHTMAGANKVIPVVQTTANIISDMLRKPIITGILHNILYEKSNLKVAQIKVNNGGYFDGKNPSDVDWGREYGIIVLFVMQDDLSKEFVYSSRAKHHDIVTGDIFIVVGYDADIKEFEKLIGGDEV